MTSLLGGALLGHSAIPTPALRRFVDYALADFEVYLCLHRVGSSQGASRDAHETVISALELDRLLDLLGCGRSGRGTPRITATFDDGYADAVEYVRSRYAMFPNINWALFVCPAKTRQRVGFRWDLDDTQDLHADTSIERENGRLELKGLADQQRCRLATIEELRAISALPRVSLGNHTNCHFALASLDAADSARELAESRRDFEDLFGVTDQFAFPFGVRNVHYGPEHIVMLKAENYRRLFSVAPKPIGPSERQEAEVIPRFAVMGSWPGTKTALYICLVAARAKLKAKAKRLMPRKAHL